MFLVQGGANKLLKEKKRRQRQKGNVKDAATKGLKINAKKREKLAAEMANGDEMLLIRTRP